LEKTKIINRIGNIENRVMELEMALMHLMVVVANQEEELPEFKKSLEKAKELTDDESMISGMLFSNKAEA
jgi:hypothetical protein|tara:strand:- start:307 stop:516 length:210 start_codon:yes stop_codon:yes gene_type:complete